MSCHLECPKYYSKININEKIFLFIRTVLTILSIYLLCYGHPISIPAFLIGITSITVIILYIFQAEKSTWKQNEIKLYILIGISAVELYFFFLSSSRVAKNKKLMDESLVKIDEFFLGKLFPKGQISLYLDENKNFGPKSTGGKIINNILIIFYFTYYLNPYIFIFLVLFIKCIKETIFRYKNKGQKSNTYFDSWNKFYFTLSVYIATYIQIFFINSLVPAISPRLYLKDEYKNEIVYVGLNKYMVNIRDDGSANSFPSGHVAETFCLVFPFFGMKRYFIAVFVIIVSLLIGLATVILRYHYFVDVLVGMLNSTLAYLVCYSIRIILQIKYPELNAESKIEILEKLNSSENKERNEEEENSNEEEIE